MSYLTLTFELIAHHFEGMRFRSLEFRQDPTDFVKEYILVGEPSSPWLLVVKHARQIIGRFGCNAGMRLRPRFYIVARNPVSHLSPEWRERRLSVCEISSIQNGHQGTAGGHLGRSPSGHGTSEFVHELFPDERRIAPEHLQRCRAPAF
jgi:hypothetical protein